MLKKVLIKLKKQLLIKIQVCYNKKGDDCYGYCSYVDEKFECEDLIFIKRFLLASGFFKRSCQVIWCHLSNSKG